MLLGFLKSVKKWSQPAQLLLRRITRKRKHV